MSRKIVLLPSLSRVQPGSKATLEIPTGPTYMRVDLTVSAAAGLDATDIGKISVLLNGNVAQEYTNLQRLLDLNTYYDRDSDSVAATSITFALHFFRGELLSAQRLMYQGQPTIVDYRRMPGIGTDDVASFHIEMDIAAAAPADIAITAHAYYDPVSQPLGVFTRVRELPAAFAVAGLVEVDKLLKGPIYQAIHLFKSDVTSVEVLHNSVKIIEATKSILERLAQSASPVKRVPVTARATHIDFCLEGDVEQCLVTSERETKDFRIKMNITAAGNVDVVTETFDKIDTQA